ncbi:uncharacterized protein LOC123671988 isoform X2 [Harmonia axyridis]|uniref:uncharacterized protein LOC123671988 isoform X2 n=1 Tax=Harmonia axyridis TaxID=115357 RepID=UPI001E2752E1|nr:uncharacterized protein LOC123671988 isoform X2 [Harmonia axyridis]
MGHAGVTNKIKECIGSQVHKESANDMATLHPDKSGKWSIKLRMFYNKHFPTDKDSYAVRFSVVGLALSLCSLQVFFNLQWKEYRERREFYIWALILLLSSATYGLYYGMKIGDRKQFTPWMIFKIIEIITTTISLVNTLAKPYYNRQNDSINIVIGFVVLFGNFFLISIICRRKKENLYNVPDEAVDEFSPVMSKA